MSVAYNFGSKAVKDNFSSSIGSSRGGSVGLIYLLDSQFLTDGTPSDPYTPEPGPGDDLDLVNTTNSTIDISGEQLTMTRPTTGQGYPNLGFASTGSYVRKTGRVLYAEVSSTIIDREWVALMRTTGAPADGGQMGVRFASAAAIDVNARPAGVIRVGSSLSGSTTYQIAISQRGNGAFHFIRGGSQYPNWTLLYVSMGESELDLYPIVSNFNSQLSIDTFQLADKDGAWALEYGLATVFEPIVADPETFDHPADTHIYITWTPDTSDTLIIELRKTDDNNVIELRCDQAAGTIRLYRVEGGVDNELDAGKTQSWVVGTDYRIWIRAAGSEIRSGVNDVLKHNTTETFNQTETDGVISGVAGVCNLEVYPVTFSGTDLETLQP